MSLTVGYEALILGVIRKKIGTNNKTSHNNAIVDAIERPLYVSAESYEHGAPRLFTQNGKGIP